MKGTENSLTCTEKTKDEHKMVVWYRHEIRRLRRL